MSLSLGAAGSNLDDISPLFFSSDLVGTDGATKCVVVFSRRRPGTKGTHQEPSEAGLDGIRKNESSAAQFLAKPETERARLILTCVSAITSKSPRVS